MVTVERLEVDGNEPGLPVVDVEQLRSPGAAERDEGLEGAPAEEHEALAVVPVVAVGSAIEAFPVEVLILGEQVHGNAAGTVRFLQRALDHAIAQGHGETRHDRADLRGMQLDSTVVRHENADVVAEGAQGSGQRARHVTQPARLGEGRCLGRYKQDPQT